MPGSPRYEKLKHLLRDKIVSGRYQPGERFYSQNELMAKYGLSFSTVTRALDELELEGYLVRKRGKGTFIEAVQPLKSGTSQSTKRICLFMPCYPHQPLLSFSTLVYKHLELLHPESVILKFIPHGTEADDLEPFLFKLEPTDTVVFLYPVEPHLEFIRMLAQSQQVLVVSHAPVDISCYSIITPVSQASEAATSHLLQLGHDRIALVGDTASLESLPLLDGYRSALRHASVPFRETLISRGASAGTGSLADILARNTDGGFTAIVATSTVSALSVVSELRAMGEEPGQTMALACYDDLEKADSLYPGVSTVTFSSRSVAIDVLQVVGCWETSSSKAIITLEPILTSGSPATCSGSLGPMK